MQIANSTPSIQPTTLPQFLASRTNDIGLVLDPNIHYLMAKLGLERFVLYVSAILWLGLGIWIFVHRQKICGFCWRLPPWSHVCGDFTYCTIMHC